MLPDVAALLQRIAQSDVPDIVEMPLNEARRAYEASCALLDKAGPQIAHIKDFAIESDTGAIPARLYDPAPGTSALTHALVFFHGGGFVIGNLDTHDGFVRRLVRVLGIPAIAVDYRLAPEHPFPAAIEDCMAAAQWASKALSAMLGRAVSGLIVVGDSAGGNAAAVVAHSWVDTGAVPLALQVLLYPATDHAHNYPSFEAHVDGKLLERNAIDFFANAYVPEGTDPQDPRLSPLYAALDKTVPPAVIAVAELDPLHDEGIAYAQKLKSAGVAVSVLDEPGLIHGFYTLRGALPAGDESVDRLADLIKNALSTP
ncbi:MAG: alpha/beta hydrolase [Pseudomonadota bacterium]